MNKQYYFANTIWQDKFNVDKICRFNNIQFGDKIYLIYDYDYSYLKISSKLTPNKTMFISAINCCLRLKEKIRQIYPYNDIYVCIFVKDRLINHTIDISAFRSVVDIIPDFALITARDIKYLTNNIKCIIYGKCTEVKKSLQDIDAEVQYWSTINGNLLIK